MLKKEIKNIKSTKKDLRKFGLTVGIFLAVLGSVFFGLEKDHYTYFLFSGIALTLTGLAVPVVLKPLQKAWMAAAIILGWFMTRVILGILFYVVFTSIGWIAKLFGKQFLELKWDKSKETYWNYREIKEFDKSVYEKQF